MKTDSKTRGVTLVEVMVTLAILGVLLGLAWPTLADMISRHRVTVVAAEVRSNLVYARSEANRQDKRLQVNFGGNAGMSCYTVYLDTGPVGDRKSVV